MDGPRLDTLARLLATGAPRRRIIGSLVAVLPAALFGLRWDQAAAACKKVGRTCDKTKDCCDGAECKGKKCTCKKGRDECGGKCFKLDGDENNCGRCNNACDGGEFCAEGACVTGQGTCPTGADTCRAGTPLVCNPSSGTYCLCLRSAEGATRCGRPTTLTCGQCESSADCVALGFGAGSFCVDVGTEAHCECSAGEGLCAVPCPT